MQQILHLPLYWGCPCRVSEWQELGKDGLARSEVEISIKILTACSEEHQLCAAHH